MANGVHALPAELLEPPSEPIELLIGRTTAMAASLIAVEIQERQNGEAQPQTARNAADAIGMLFELRRATLATGELAMPFEMIAWEEGFRALREHCDNSDGLIADLIDGVIEILGQVVEWSQTNTFDSAKNTLGCGHA
jgi:hypothetical protein